jgi:hypothetical protein
MIFLSPLLFAALFGFLFLAWAIGNSPVPRRPLFFAAFSLPAGLVGISILLFWAYVLAGARARLTVFVFFFLACALLLIAAVRSGTVFSPAPVIPLRTRLRQFTDTVPFWKKAEWIAFSRKVLPLTLWGLVLAAALYRFIHYLLFFLSRAPHGSWDAKFFWSLKAKFLFRSPDVWRDMFSPVLAWAHPDYPLFLPASTAWGWLWTGKEVLIWPNVVAYVFAFGLLLLLIWHLGCEGPLWNGFAAASFLALTQIYRLWSFSLMADVPLCFFIAAACSFLLLGLRRKSCGLVFLTGFFAGAAAWCKNEGLFVVLWITLIFGGILLTDAGWERERKIKAALRFFSGLALPLSCVLYLKLFLVPPSEFAANAKGFGPALNLIFGDLAKTRFILLSFLNFMITPPHWNGFWYFFPLALVYGLAFKRPSWRSGHGWAAAALTLLIQGGYVLIYHVTPHDLAWHLQTSLPRLLLHSAMPALIFMFETLAPENSGAPA